MVPACYTTMEALAELMVDAKIGADSLSPKTNALEGILVFMALHIRAPHLGTLQVWDDDFAALARRLGFRTKERNVVHCLANYPRRVLNGSNA